MARGLYALKIKAGWFRRTRPVRSWEHTAPGDAGGGSALPDIWLSRLRSRPRFFISAADVPAIGQALLRLDPNAGKQVLAEADGILAGHFRYFGCHGFDLAFPPNWLFNPFTGTEFPGGHWSEIDDFRHGDIKGVWELNRFGFVFTLVRAFAVSDNTVYVEAFWQLLEDWREKNPPNWGPNWKCGQEVSFRLMAWCFGLFAFLDHPASTPERVAMLMQMIEESGHRIAANIPYALSQQNNHSISEPAALWTIATLFPELPQARRWQRAGAHHLERQGLKLIYADGSFAQHSVIYHRLVLQVYLWVWRIAKVNRFAFSEPLQARLSQAVQFIYHMQDEKSGQVPYYGLNDGSDLLPLHGCGYHDFRPLLQAAYFVFNGTKCYTSGAWDELLLWMSASLAEQAVVRIPGRRDLQARAGGYFVFRGNESQVFTRCARFKHRPGQADMLHIDVWWRGLNIALDAGTFSYNMPGSGDSFFAETAFHNSVTVDGSGQMHRAGRFVWLPWVTGRVRCERHSDHLFFWQGDHDGYRRLPSPVHYSRSIIRLPEDSWLILDSLQAESEHEYTLHWLLADVSFSRLGDFSWELLTSRGPYRLYCGTLQGRLSSRVTRAEEHSNEGWQSPFYLHKTPARSITLSSRRTSQLMWSLFSPMQLTISPDLVINSPSWQADVQFDPELLHVSRINLTGRFTDSIRV